MRGNGETYKWIVIEDFDHNVRRFQSHIFRIAADVNRVKQKSLIPRWTQRSSHLLSRLTVVQKRHPSERI